MRKIIIGVMGPGERANFEEMDIAYQLGMRIAERGWIVLSGGRNCGVMDAVCRGAKNANGITMGILPSESKTNASSFLDIVIPTGLGSARNNINVLASDAIIVCGMGAGTASEVALAIKAKKSVILLKSTYEAQTFFNSLDSGRVLVVSTVDESITAVNRILNQ